MVCPRCISVVETILIDLHISYNQVNLGEIDLDKIPHKEALNKLDNSLKINGFERLDNAHQKMVERLKTQIIQKIQSEEISEHFLLSDFIREQFNTEYSQLSRLFSQVEGVTLEQYFLLQKMEKVKELLSYNQLTLSEIAWKLGYKSVQHLSAQFKNLTGMTPTQFKKLKENTRKSIDEI